MHGNLASANYAMLKALDLIFPLSYKNRPQGLCAQTGTKVQRRCANVICHQTDMKAYLG